MRRVILAICTTAAALALLLSFKTHAQGGLGASPAAALGTPAPSGGSGGTTGRAATAATAGAAPQSTGTATATGQAASSATATTVTGDAVQTIYGPVQVQVTVKAGKVTAVNAVEYPTGTSRDYEINSYAIPQLNQEALTAGSAHIDAVSGATYTSGGYISSLQSALDKAGI